MITFCKITEKNFYLESMDGFDSRQEVTECWRWRDGRWALLPVSYTDACAPDAAAVLAALQAGSLAYGAWEDGRLVGLAVLDREPFGSKKQYLDLAELHVARPFRGRGIGKKLFGMACEGARELGAEKLYISAHSAKETMAAYHALGCVEAAEINWTLARKEPCDVQLEFLLSSG